MVFLITNGCCQNDNDENAVLKADFIIHFIGENIAEKRWTAKRKAEIIDSREQSTQLLYSVLKKNNKKQKHLFRHQQLVFMVL
jgi:NAD dependent epimerase/dehydratase family enzyme